MMISHRLSSSRVISSRPPDESPSFSGDAALVFCNNTPYTSPVGRGLVRLARARDRAHRHARPRRLHARGRARDARARRRGACNDGSHGGAARRTTSLPPPPRGGNGGSFFLLVAMTRHITHPNPNQPPPPLPSVLRSQSVRPRLACVEVLVVDAAAGVQAQTCTVWRQAVRHGVPALALINKMDKARRNTHTQKRGGNDRHARWCHTLRHYHTMTSL